MSDISIWNYAKEEGYTIASKDDNFEKIILLKKALPKFIYLKIFYLFIRTIFIQKIIQEVIKHKKSQIPLSH